MSPLWSAISVTARLATLTTLILLVLGMPLAWWLARTRSSWRIPVGAVVALPMVLPPTVLGFYLLVGMGPHGPLGQLAGGLGLGHLAFTFEGLLLASVLYSLPFVVHPLQAGFAGIDAGVLDAAATLRASPLDRFVSVVLPLSRPALVTAALLGFAHTVGEFGVVLMVGGSIPGETKTIAISIYDRVQSFDLAGANQMALVLVLFSLVAVGASFFASARLAVRR